MAIPLQLTQFFLFVFDIYNCATQVVECRSGDSKKSGSLRKKGNLKKKVKLGMPAFNMSFYLVKTRISLLLVLCFPMLLLPSATPQRCFPVLLPSATSQCFIVFFRFSFIFNPLVFHL